MAKDMIDGEIRKYKGKKYKYKDIEAMETDMNWLESCCQECAFENCCPEDIKEFEEMQNILGNCYEMHRKDKRNGIFELIE